MTYQRQEHEQKRSQAAATRQLIRDAFIDLYLQKPLSKISVSEITGASHVSRGTFYLYFEDIFRLLESVEDEFLSGVMTLNAATIFEALKRKPSVDTYVESYAQMLGYILENKRIFRALLTGSESVHFRQKYVANIKRSVCTMLEIDKRVPEDQWDLSCAFHAGGVINLFENWMMNDFRDSPEEIAGIVYKALFRGLMNLS